MKDNGADEILWSSNGFNMVLHTWPMHTADDFIFTTFLVIIECSEIP